MALADKWSLARPLHENHPDFVEAEALVTQTTQSEGPFFYVITNKGVLRFARPLAVDSNVEVTYIYNPPDLVIGDTSSTIPDLPSGYHEVIVDVATRDMFSTPGDDDRAKFWDAIAQKSLGELVAAVKYRVDNQAQRTNKRRRLEIGPDGQLTIAIDQIEGPSQSREGTKTT